MKTNNPVKILLVDDLTENLFALEVILSNENYLFVKANSGNEALKILLHDQDFAIILMDVQMPDMDGFETAELIRETENLKHVPIIFLTASMDGSTHIFKGYLAGAVDYMIKPLSPEILRAKVAVFAKMKEYELALKESEERFSVIFQFAPVGLSLATMPDGALYDVNQAWLDIVGCTNKEDVIGKSFLELGVLPEPEQRERILKEFWQNGNVRNAEMMFLSKTGMKRTILTNVDTIDINGRKFMLSTNDDITERKKADARLRTLMVGIEQSPVTTVITDVSGKIQYVNPKFTEITGYTAEEVIGQNPSILKTQHKSSLEYKELWNTLLSGQNWHGVFHNIKKSGELYWESAVISPVKDLDGTITHFLAVKEDITERKLKETQLEKYASDLKELNATKDKFFSIIAHDLKNPFAVLRSSSELLYKYLEKKNLPKSKAKAEQISKASNHGYALLENLLVWAQSQTGGIKFEPQKFNFKNKVAESITEVEDHASGKNISIETEISDDLVLEADENLLSVVFRNLITNAIKFTHNGGSITIKAKADEHLVEVAVIDTGIGIPKEHQHKLFRIDDHYSRVGTANETSSSLGLILCKEFIEKHNGKIWVESEVDKGSEFKFTIPMLQPVKKESTVSDANPIPPPTPQLTIEF